MTQEPYGLYWQIEELLERMQEQCRVSTLTPDQRQNCSELLTAGHICFSAAERILASQD